MCFRSIGLLHQWCTDVSFNGVSSVLNVVLLQWEGCEEAALLPVLAALTQTTVSEFSCSLVRYDHYVLFHTLTSRWSHSNILLLRLNVFNFTGLICVMAIWDNGLKVKMNMANALTSALVLFVLLWGYLGLAVTLAIKSGRTVSECLWMFLWMGDRMRGSAEGSCGASPAQLLFLHHCFGKQPF